MSFRSEQRKNPSKEPLVLAISNQKGGVGKTTTVVNLSAALGDMGYKVLVVDFDPQGNTTSGFGVDKDGLALDAYDVLVDDAQAGEAIVKTRFDGVYLIASTVQLAGAEIELVNMENRERVLKKALDSVKENFDYVFIDCPPSLGLLTINAFAAADSLLIPIQCEYYALEGVTKLLETIKAVQRGLNPHLRIFGVLMTMYDSRTTLSKQVVTEVKNYFGGDVFNTMIPRSVKVSEAPSYGMPVIDYARFNKGSIAYRELAKEVVKRG